ncbi:hypothetical protein [Variovorax paradoxus]|uniref:hypothetical protein n=1 Tax=Variovorax paradoxus TaxID=34073 RepID=UPI0019318CB4|nr:hypothetical protein INQ48_20630 [Variovorax paradoxus]
MSVHFTRGPWRLAKLTGDYGVYAKLGCDARESRIATLPSIAYPIRAKEYAANARAIAALPEIISAAQSAVHSLALVTPSAFYAGSALDQLTRALSKLEEASD